MLWQGLRSAFAALTPPSQGHNTTKVNFSLMLHVLWRLAMGFDGAAPTLGPWQANNMANHRTALQTSPRSHYY